MHRTRALRRTTSSSSALWKTERSVFGEGVPRDYVTGETIDSSLQLLRDSAHDLQLETCREFGQAVSMAERLVSAPRHQATRGVAGAMRLVVPLNCLCSTLSASISAVPFRT